MPEAIISGMSEWQKRIKRFPIKIREVVISGGEPMIVPYFSDFVNWLLGEGYFVTVLTNLTYQRGLAIKPSFNLRFCATHHVKANIERFKYNLESYQKKYKIDVDEIEKSEIPGSRTKPYCKKGDDVYGLFYGPDGFLFTSFLDIVKWYAS